MHIYIWSPPPPHDPPVFFFPSLKNTVFCSTFCLFAFHNFAKQFFYLTPEKYVVFPRFSGQKRRIICVLAHFRALNRETSFFLLQHRHIRPFVLEACFPQFCDSAKPPETKKPKNQNLGENLLVSTGFLVFLVLHCVFWFLGRKTKKTHVFFWFSWCSLAEKPTKRMCFFGFWMKNQKLLGF